MLLASLGCSDALQMSVGEVRHLFGNFVNRKDKVSKHIANGVQSTVRTMTWTKKREMCSQLGNTALHYAIHSGDLRVVHGILWANNLVPHLSRRLFRTVKLHALLDTRNRVGNAYFSGGPSILHHSVRLGRRNTKWNRCKTSRKNSVSVFKRSSR